jgi:DNA repair protein RecO (recombination protein O)
MRIQAIILKKIPIREYDELVVCYTKDLGKQVYQAKSILRPTSKQAGHLDVLSLVDFSLIHKNSHPIIASAYCMEAFRGLKSSLPAMAAAYFLLECFDKLVFDGESDPKLWDFLHSRLCEYDELAGKRGVDWSSEVGSSREKLLGVLGYGRESSLENLANANFKSLQFARRVVK